ncbi:MAG TPA: twin-arginine translocation signal domain-containing protein, partial [Verrucomicrobiota bacterium]|nr:twin-arginine translocation signal domain-containing protein [Verrucomicrobiota bacterium]
MKTTRRSFLKSALTLGGAAVAFPTIIPSTVLGRNGKVAPSNRVCMAFIGTGNQGTGDMSNFLRDRRVQVVAVCDVNRESDGYWDNAIGGREPARRRVNDFYAQGRDSGVYNGCAVYADFRPMIERP